MSDLPPLPWSWEDNGFVDRPLGHGFVYILDANGRKIGTIWGKPHEKVAVANLIIQAAMREALARGIDVR